MPPPDTQPANEQGRHRPHLPRQGEAHRQRQLRRVGRAGHGRRRVHRLRPAEPVRRVQARLAAVAVRPVHQRFQPELHRSAHQAVARLGDDLGVSPAVALHHSRHRPVEHARAASCSSASRFRTRGSRASSSSYGGERVKLRRRRARLARSTATAASGRRSGFTLDHDTRVGTSVPGGRRARERRRLQLNGGPLGGTAIVPALTTEMRSYATLATFGEGARHRADGADRSACRREPARVFGDPGPFFVSQAFSLGGVQYGEQLRGYEEFSITPQGYLPNADQFQAQRSSFGNAFYTQHGRARASGQPAALSGCVLRRRQPLGAAA